MKRFIFIIFLILVLGFTNLAIAQYIPGLAAVDIHGNFTNKGFILKKNLNLELASWICTQETSESYYEVSVFGKGPTKITRIEATALNYTNKDTASVVKDFLGYVATISYTGSQPTKARQWVIDNINKNASMSIGSIRFKIYANSDSPRSRILEMKPIK